MVKTYQFDEDIDDDRIRCNECDEKFYEDDVKYCEGCEEYFCPDCFKKHQLAVNDNE